MRGRRYWKGWEEGEEDCKGRRGNEDGREEVEE
jgi:hypothetical protein